MSLKESCAFISCRRTLRFTAGSAGAAALLLTIGLHLVLATSGGGGSISLTAGTYTQDFNTLAITGTSSGLPTGWLIDESGTSTRNDGQYTAGTGAENTGDIYSYGSSGSADRALGTLRSGTLIPIVGASFTNNSGSTITSLVVSYTGEQWRLGTSGRADRLDFQISSDATSVISGSYIDVNALDFSSPITTGTVGALNGNLSGNRTLITSTVSNLNIANGATFFVRWLDFDASGADDALAIDDFSIAPNLCSGLAGAAASTPGSIPAGGTTLLTVTVTPAQCPTSSGVAVTANLSAIGGSATQTFFDNGSNGDVTANDNVFTFQATAGVLTTGGAKSIPATITDAQARSATVSIPLTIEPPLLAVHDIQGSGTNSPFVGQQVSTFGIVTGVKSNGFFIQQPDASVDNDPATSEGVFVFTSSAPPAAAAVGNSVRVSGTVAEFVPASDLNSPSMTEISGSPVVVVLSSGNPLPAARTLTSTDMSINDVNNIERLEGMRVHVDSLTVVGPTQGSINEAAATATSNGVFYGVISGTPRPFREPGIQVPDPVLCASCQIPRFDANPERLRVDSDGLLSTQPIEVTAGATVAGLTGPLDYAFRTYTLLPDPPPAAPPSVSGNISAASVPAPTAEQFTVASFNMERFFDTTDDPSVSDVALTVTAFNNRLNKASLAIRDVMRFPDILGVVEMENLATLQALATKVNTDAAGAGQPNPNYVAYLAEGNDIGGIDVGFLVKSGRVNVISVTQSGKTDMFINPNNGQPELLNDRPPLILRAEVAPLTGPPQAVTVIVNHLRSLSGVDDPVDGNRVRTKRRAQAEFLANLIQARQLADPLEHIVSIGDYNAFQFNDGYVDSIGTIKGTPTAANQVLLASPDLVTPDLADLSDLIPAGQRYSYVFDGNAQELDHILITTNLLPTFAGLSYARSNADFPESFRNDPARPERLSDHDMPVAYFNFPNADLGITSSPSTNSPVAGAAITYTVTVTNNLYTPASNVVMTDQLPANTTFQSLGTPAGWSCTTPAFGAAGTIQCTRPQLASPSTEVFSVVLNVDCKVPNGRQVSTTATVSSSTFDPVLSNNSVTATVTILNPPPAIAGIVVDKDLLWPANHKMVEVEVDYIETDNCSSGSSTTCSITVSSNEPINGTGDGDSSPDWEVIDSHHVLLRAERSGSGRGRMYTITITCIDDGGNASLKTVTVSVPLNRGK